MSGITAVQSWVRRYGPNGGGASAAALVTDQIGNVYVTGSYNGTNGPSDWITIAYTSAGEILWQNGYTGPGYSADTAHEIALDRVTGNVYVAGNSGFDPFANNLATIAYSSAGLPLWTNRYAEPTSCCVYAAGLAVAANGNVYLAGSTGEGLVTGTYFVVAYTGHGAALWTNRYNRPQGGVSGLHSMAVGPEDNVYLNGFSTACGSAADYLTVAYSASGMPLWTNCYNGPADGHNSGAGMAVDASGNIYVTGDSEGIGTGADFATIAYSRGGLSLWTNRYNGPGNGGDTAGEVAVGSSGSVYVTGGSSNTNNRYDCATIAYSTAGTPLWTNRYGAGGQNTSGGGVLVVDTAGNVVVTAFSTAQATGRDIVTFAYSSTGIPLWTNRYNGLANGTDQPVGIAAGPNGSIYVAGYSARIIKGVTNNEMVTIKYVPAPDIRFRKIHPLPDASYRLSMVAPTNTPYRLEASSDLLSWLPLTNFPPLPVVRLQYTDTSATNFPRRFYRTVWVP
jgi:hypothetical protein